jgi:ligand-binding sensor domain-containing protein
VISAVWAVAEGADGALWLGTSKGVFRGRPGGRWQRFSVASGHLRDDWVTALAARGTKVLVGTYNGGVASLEPAGDGSGFRASARCDGWVNLGGLAFVGEALHVATMDGLLRCAADAGAGCRPIAGAAPGRDVTAVAQGGGLLWVASRRGLGAVLLPSPSGAPRLRGAVGAK